MTDVRYADTFFRELSPDLAQLCRGHEQYAPRVDLEPVLLSRARLRIRSARPSSMPPHSRTAISRCDMNAVHIEAPERMRSALGIDNVRFHAAASTRWPLLDCPLRLHRDAWRVQLGESRPRAMSVRIVARAASNRRTRVRQLQLLARMEGRSAATQIPRELRRQRRLTAPACRACRAELGRLQTGKCATSPITLTAAPAIGAYRKGQERLSCARILQRDVGAVFFHGYARRDGGVGLSYVGSATLTTIMRYCSSRCDDAHDRSLSNARQQQLCDGPGSRPTLFGAMCSSWHGATRSRGGSPLHRHAAHWSAGDLGDLKRRRCVYRRGDISFRPAFIDELREVVADGAITMAAAVWLSVATIGIPRRSHAI